MLVLPVETTNHAGDLLIIVLDDTQIKRMATADPAEVKMKQFGKNLVTPTIIICHESDMTSLKKVIDAGDLSGIARYLTRGFQFRPDLGDHDRGPEKLDGTPAVDPKP